MLLSTLLTTQALNSLAGPSHLPTSTSSTLSSHYGWVNHNMLNWRRPGFLSTWMTILPVPNLCCAETIPTHPPRPWPLPQEASLGLILTVSPPEPYTREGIWSCVSYAGLVFSHYNMLSLGNRHWVLLIILSPSSITISDTWKLINEAWWLTE